MRLGCGLGLDACGDDRTRDSPSDANGVDSPDATTRGPSFATFGFSKQDNPSLSTDIKGVITGHSVRVNLPNGTDLSALVASWTPTDLVVTVGGVPQVSGVTANAFNRPVAYTLTDGTSATFQVTGALPVQGFDAAVTFAGQRPFGIAIADLQGDGKPDVVTVEGNGRGFAFYVNRTQDGAAAPDFDAEVQLLSPSDAFGAGAAVADINGDGKPDLLAVYDNFFIEIRLNTTPDETSPPTFGPALSFPTGSGSTSIAIADFDADDRPDVAVSNTNASTTSLLMNTTASAAPSFTSQDLPTGETPISVAIDDFNGDGLLDIVVANNNPGTVSVLLNTTPPGVTVPTFSPNVDFPVGGLAHSVATADFNGDGKPDLAIANGSSNNIAVFLNTTPVGASTPTFVTDGPTFAVNCCVRAVIAPDVDADGRPDLIAVTDATFSNVALMFNQTPTNDMTASFTARADIPTGPDPAAVAFGDFNADGRVDVAVSASGNGTDLGGATLHFGLAPP